MRSCVFQSDRFQSGIPADFYRSKAQAQKSPPSSFSSLSSFQPVQKQRPSANQLLSTQAEGDLLLGTLRQYLSGRASLHSGGASPSERLRTFYGNGMQNSGLKKEASKSRLVNMGRTQGVVAKVPLTSVDGMYFNHDGVQTWQRVWHVEFHAGKPYVSLTTCRHTHLFNCECCQTLQYCITLTTTWQHVSVLAPRGALAGSPAVPAWWCRRNKRGNFYFIFTRSFWTLVACGGNHMIFFLYKDLHCLHDCLVVCPCLTIIKHINYTCNNIGAHDSLHNDASWEAGVNGKSKITARLNTELKLSVVLT